ncbi:MAG: nuclear transport factor 2 family protein [Candidatus Thiodiazotropha endolucinida]
MIGNKLELRTPDEAEIIYYEAFMRCDQQLMAALWADGDVVCIHPGAGAIVGHEKIVHSWSNIFSGAQRPDIRYKVVKTAPSGDLAVHLVTEEISTGDEAYALILATNVYQKFEGGWLMVQHHASMVQVGRSQHTLQ